MSFAEYQGERTRERARKSEHPSIFPVRDIPFAVFRLGHKNKTLKELAATIKTKGAEAVLPAEILTTDDNGDVGIDLALFKTPGTLTQSWEQDVPGVLKLAELLDEDLLLSGGESTEVAHFRQERELRAREVAVEMLVNLRRETDFEHELVGVATEHSFATKEEKESFEKLETWTQNIVDGLFIAAGLTYMKPQVHVTRSREVNAWVWSVAHEDATAEYLAVAKKSAEPVELPIFVHYGLFKQITSQDELAGVLAHEFSHLLQPNYLGLQDNESRQRLEYDADATGARLADAAGSNPRGLINFLRKLPESGTAQKFGWGTHPETARRIIELEKQFSRTDLPFPNAGKPLAPVPTDIAAALETIRKTPYRKSADFSGPRSDEQALESYLETQTEAGYYMNVERQAGFTAEARTRLKELQVEQELAHDVTGQRTLLLTKLESCLLGLAQRPSLGPDDSIYLSCPTPYKVEARKLPDGTAKNVIRLGALPERVLSLPKNLSFLRPGKNAEVDEETQRNISNEQLNQRDYLVRDTPPDVQASYAAGWRAKTIEDWIDPDNATVQPFWDEVIKNIKDGRKGGMDSEVESVLAHLTREERLYFIWNWLTRLVAVPQKTGGYGRYDFLSVDKSYLVERETEIPLELPSKPKNILSRLPKIAGRVHQRHEEGEPPIPIKFEIKKEKHNKTLVSQSPCGQHLIQNLWDDRPEGQPPAITAYTELVQEQTMNAYREILSAEGVDDVDPEMLRYTCARLFDSGYHTPEFSSTPPSNSRLSFRLIPEISISCLSQAIKILETRQLAKVFGSDETELSKHQKAAIEGLRTAVAFGFVPQNEEERAIQERHLRQIELYTSAAGMVVDHIPEGKECFPNERYTTVRGNRLDIGHMDTFQSATGERVWSQTGDIVQHLLKGKAFKALITPDELRPGEPSSHDHMKVRHGVSCAYFRAEERDVHTIYAGMEQALQHFPAVVRAYVDYLYKKGVSTKEGVARLYADETEQVAGQRDYARWQMLEPLLDTVARELYEKFHEGVSAPKERYKTDRGYQPVTVEDFHHVLRIITRGIWPVPDLMKHARFATVDSPWLEQKVAPTNVPLRDEADGHEAVFFYTPHESPKTFKPEEAVTKERAIEYLELLAESKPAAATLAATLRDWPQKEFPAELAVVCLGHFSPFKADYHTTDEVLGWSYDTKATTDNVIKVWRQAAAVYHEEWQHIEQYKCLDEQLSTWEWTREDNNLFEVGVEKFAGHRKRTSRSEDLPQPKITPGKGAESFAHFFETLLHAQLESRYRTASSQHTTIKFSWPLFMTDVWEGKDVFLYKETQEKCQYIVDAFRAELLRIVADPNNLGEIKQMEPGFFREFLLAKKIEQVEIKDLDDLEPWLEYFTSYAHEGSARNQTTGLVETTRRNHREKRKEELLTAAVLEALPDPDYLKFFYLVTAPGDTSLTDSDVSISYYDHIITNDLTQLQNKIQEARSDTRMGALHKDALVAQLEADERELRQFYGSITTGWWIEKIYERYEALVNEARSQASTLGQADESDVFVFSDQVIENDKSRLEVGPIYRYRLAAQKLMDWHSSALRAAQTPEAAVALQARVDKVLPDRHPLKDVFVKNQAAMEIWQTLRAALTPEELAATGIELTEKSVDLKHVLAQFPLYAEAAFLPEYTIFEVTGLAKAITDIPRATAETILERLETVVQKEVSPDQHSVVRRLLIDLEKRVRWPEWRVARRTDANVYNEQLGRILELFPEPSLERDDVLESIGMDLAYTPEQIRQVNHLTYIEQTRWPKEKEAKSLRPQHTGLEKMRGFLSMLKSVERAQYLVWFAGGPMPLGETLSAEKTGISLEDRAKTFWGLSATERRNLLYDFCLGKEGVMEKSGKFKSHSDKSWPERLRDTDMIKYVADNLFEQAFGDNAIDPDQPSDTRSNVRGREMIQTIFSELLVHQPEAGRRAELLTNILEAIGSVRQEGRNLRPGELIRVLLEQIGVVGIKIGQVLSEQVGLLPESIRQDLLQLKDKTAQFSKRGILTYLESAGWVRGNESKVEMIGDALGSASIKQVQDGRLDDDREVAIKAKRPSIDKNYQADIKVVERVFHTLEQKGFTVPSYLLAEVTRVISEELSFVHEAENQVAMGASLQARNAKLELNFGGVRETVPLAVSAPLAVSEVLYPGPEQTADIGLIVEEKIKGLSLKEIQAYQAALTAGNDKLTNEFRDKVAHLYDPGRVEEIENKIKELDTGKLQASLALEFLREVVKGGVFHADLHSGNFYLDFTPQVVGSEVYNQRAVLIDLGSTGYSRPEARPPHLQTEPPEQFAGAEQFRDFLSALFSQTPKSGKIAEIVNQFTNLAWDAARVQALSGDITDTGEKVKKIFYAILDEGRGTIDTQFRYFLKAVATAADHLTKLRTAVEPEIDLIKSGRQTETFILPQLMNENLLNIGLLL